MTTTKTITASPTQPAPAAAKPLTFDERLALAALAIDARTTTQPLDLADVIRLPLTPTAAPCPYTTPIAGLLHRARTRLEMDGWGTGALRDEQGRRCALGAIRAEAQGNRGAEADAATVLLEAIRRRFPGAESVPSWNDSQSDSTPVVLLLGEAAAIADARGI